MELFDHIGYHGPTIVFILTFYLIWQQKPYLYVFLVMSLLNIYINEILKNIIQEPRPMPIDLIDNTTLNGAHVYGMPSCHAQAIFFYITFLFMVTNSMSLLLFTLFIGGLTLYQRWKFKRHSVIQLFVGSSIGLIFAVSIYIITTQSLQS